MLENYDFGRVFAGHGRSIKFESEDEKKKLFADFR